MSDSGRAPIRILLVDDEPFILAATAQLLRSAGHTVSTCEQWTGVATKVRVERPDLILLDYNMPTLKGDDLCTILKRNLDHEGMKIILFSSEDEAFLRSVVPRCGADGYIKKDVASTVLLSSITRAITALA